MRALRRQNSFYTEFEGSHNYCSLFHTGQCVPLEDVAYGGGNEILVSGRYNIQPTWEACQITCQGITDCTHWTWFEVSSTAELNCELHHSDSFPLPVPGALSGEKNC